eukprot:2292839-Amphidinium_carterae.1
MAPCVKTVGSVVSWCYTPKLYSHVKALNREFKSSHGACVRFAIQLASFASLVCPAWASNAVVWFESRMAAIDKR